MVAADLKAVGEFINARAKGDGVLLGDTLELHGEMLAGTVCGFL